VFFEPVFEMLKSDFGRRIDFVMQGLDPAERSEITHYFLKNITFFSFRLTISDLKVLKISKRQNPCVFEMDPLFFR